MDDLPAVEGLPREALYSAMAEFSQCIDYAGESLSVEALALSLKADALKAEK
ncbi:hypothetical protein [Allohahella marinimesophila]|uniref:Uncharacterized protein n=1 Tax=Allohahella marinimesophila TaxID=1054972 RepID=A0ABP7Q8U6_9GAMM